MLSSRKYCPHCACIGHVVKWGQSRQKRTRYKCRACKKTFCGRTGTVRFKTRLNEKQWASLPKLLSLRTHPSGADLGRFLNTSVCTGQRIMRKTRSLLPIAAPTQQVGGIAELDETTFKGQWIGGAKQRRGKLALLPLSNRGMKTINGFVEKLVSPKATVFTDEWGGYMEVHLSRDHFTVCHAREFVSSFCKKVHTNGIEGVWGHAKPLAAHTYRGYPKIPDFLKEICFQFNFNYHERKNYLHAHFSRILSTNTLCP